MATMDKGFGALQDPIDHNDWPLYPEDHPPESHSAPASAASQGAPAPVIKVVADLPPVYDQGPIGSCVPNAVLGALRFALKKDAKTDYDKFEPSRLYLYWQSRVAAIYGLNADIFNNAESTVDKIKGFINEDTGSWNRLALLSVRNLGLCKEELWPYGNPTSEKIKGTQKIPFTGLDKKPNPVDPLDWQKVNDDAPKELPSILAKGQKISFFRIYDTNKVEEAKNTGDGAFQLALAYNSPSVETLKSCIRDGYPFVFCSKTFRDNRGEDKDGYSLNTEGDACFWDEQMDNDGIFVKKPDPKVSYWAGGHALLAVGFDSSKGFLIQNSWGNCYTHNENEKVGQNGKPGQGQFWMPFWWFEPTTTWTVNNSGTKQAITLDFWCVKIK